MTVQTNRSKLNEEVIVDDISKDENKIVEQPALDEDKLAKLRARLAAKTKEVEMSTNRAALAKKEKGIVFGIVGSGQAGSRIAEAFYKLGYDAVAINTAQQDLKFIDIPESNKLLLEHGLGGAAKDLEIGKAARSEERRV